MMESAAARFGGDSSQFNNYRNGPINNESRNGAFDKDSETYGWQNLGTNTWGIQPPEGAKAVMGRGAMSQKEEAMDSSEGSTFSGLIGATGGSERMDESDKSNQPRMPRLGLLGGGENAMGTPPSSWNNTQTSISNTTTWKQNGANDGAGLKPQVGSGGFKQSPSWAQAAGKGLGTNENVSAPNPPIMSPQEDATPSPAVKEEDNELKMKIIASQGWGQSQINQETPWGSPDPPGMKDPSVNPNTWRAPFHSSGTEIWENNIRSRGNAPAQPVPTTTAPPWGHTPATNHGGHWGEDDVSSPSTWQGPPPTGGQWNNEQENSTWNGISGRLMTRGTEPTLSLEENGSENPAWNRSNNRGNGMNWSPKKEMISTWDPSGSPPRKDDGTHVWGNPGRQSKVCHWKENNKPNGMIRIPTKSNTDWNKGPMGRGANWQDMPPRDSPTMGNWPDDGQSKGTFGNWNDPPSNQMGWNNKPKNPGNNWSDGQVDTSSWLGPAKQGGKPLCKDIIYSSKNFRILCEYGFRKEDVENALRNNNMDLEESLTELQNVAAAGGGDMDGFGGRKVRPANMFDPMSDQNIDTFNAANFPNNFQGGMNFGGSGNNMKQSSKVPNHMGNQQIPGGNISPALIQKLLQQQQQQQQQHQLLNLNNISALMNLKCTNSNQVRQMVHQIQLAVNAGHLNAQIINQPLSPMTLQLLSQLLYQIKTLSILQQQYQNLIKSGGNNAGATSSLVAQMSQAKSRISNLQSHIISQQAQFLKQQQHNMPMTPNTPTQPNFPSVDLFKPELHNEFRELSIKDQSRLSQWKQAEGKTDESGDDFSRAPGPNKHVDSQDWGRNHMDHVWQDVGATDTMPGALPDAAKDAPSYDIIPEFEPGKPWKGTPVKNPEEDPHMTPGSIARSPLSLNSIDKSNLFWQGKGGNAEGNNSWLFSPPPTAAAPGSNSSIKSGHGKTNWNSEFGTSSDTWGPLSKPRNNLPQPVGNQAWDRQFNATFLVLRNLTPQIDGSTLKTLCMQHGPLQTFHLFLSRGVALARYGSAEEARKAQGALNNCVLGNTTMLADVPTEAEVQQYLQMASAGNGWSGNQGTVTSSSSTSTTYGNNSSSSFYGGTNWNNNGGGGGGGGGVNPTSQLWAFSGSTLWGAGEAEPSSTVNPIGPYLPNDLLGGEPI